MPPQTTGNDSREEFSREGERVVDDLGRVERVGAGPPFLHPRLAANNHYPGELNYGVRRSGAKTREQIQHLDDEEKRVQAWHKERAGRLGLHPDPYNRLHAYDYRGWWDQDQSERRQIENLRSSIDPLDPGGGHEHRRLLDKILKEREDRQGGRHPDELPEEYEHMTDEYKQHVISRAKETFGKNWKPMRNIADLTMSDLREYERAVEKFNEAREGDRRARESARRRSNFPLRDKITTPGPKGSYFDFYKTNEPASKQMEREYQNIRPLNDPMNRFRSPADGAAPWQGFRPRVVREDIRESINRPVPRAKDVRPYRGVGKKAYLSYAPLEVRDKLGGMDPEIINTLRKSPQLMDIFRLEYDPERP